MSVFAQQPPYYTAQHNAGPDKYSTFACRKIWFTQATGQQTLSYVGEHVSHKRT